MEDEFCEQVLDAVGPYAAEMRQIQESQRKTKPNRMHNPEWVEECRGTGDRVDGRRRKLGRV